MKETDFDTVYTKISAVSKNDYNKQMKELKKEGADLLNLLTGFEIEPDELNDTDKSVYGNEVYDTTYISENEMVFDYFYSNSFMINDLRGIGNLSDNENGRIIKRLFPEQITEDMIYTVGGEEYSLKEAVKFGNEKINSITKDYLFRETPHLARIAVAQFPTTNEHSYILRYYHTIDGLVLDDINNVNPDNEYLNGTYLDIEIRQKDRLFFVGNRGFCQLNRGTKADKIIPISNAEKLAASIIAENSEYTVTECELKYVRVIKSKSNEQEFKPMWVFTLEEENADEYKFRTDNFDRMNLYIDAISGEYFIYNYGSPLLITQDTN